MFMFSHFEEILRHHPAALSGGRAWRPESPLAAFERLEQRPFGQSPPPVRQRDCLSFGGGVTLLIALLGVVSAVLVL